MAPSPSLLQAPFSRAATSNTLPAPNYVNPSTRDWTAPACLIALFILSSGIFLARIWARFRITRTAGLDDWLIIASMVCPECHEQDSALIFMAAHSPWPSHYSSTRWALRTRQSCDSSWSQHFEFMASNTIFTTKLLEPLSHFVKYVKL